MSQIALRKDNQDLAIIDNILKKSFSLNTYKSYCVDILQLSEKIGKSLLEINNIDILDYFESLKIVYSNNTINRKISAVSSVFNKLAALGLIKDNPVSTAKKMKKNMNLKTQIHLSLPEKAEIEKLIQECKDKRLGIIIEFLANTGCRISEIINIKHKNILNAGRDIIIKIIGKGNKERTILIDKTFYERIMTVLNNETEYLFVTKNNKIYDRKNLWKQVKRLSKKVLNRMDIHPHTFRHFVGTNLKDKYGLDFASHYLGHSDISVTAKFYIHSDYHKIKPVLVNN